MQALKEHTSAPTLLLWLFEWTETLESGGRIDIMYTYFEKAFDKYPTSGYLVNSHLIYSVSKKNDTALACYNFHVHQSILIIFGTNVAKKASSQMVLYFPPHLTSAAALPGETESRKLHLFT